MNAAIQSFLERIPDESEVRAKLAENIREAALLRSLLRTAKKKTEVKTNGNERAKAVEHA